MNSSGATSPTPSQIRKHLGQSVWLLGVCARLAPVEWAGEESAWLAAGRPISDAQLAEWAGASLGTIAKWRLRLRKLGVLGWHVAPGHGRVFWIAGVNRMFETRKQRPSTKPAAPVAPAIWRAIQERSIALTGKLVEDLSAEEGSQLASVLAEGSENPRKTPEVRS